MTRRVAVVSARVPGSSVSSLAPGAAAELVGSLQNSALARSWVDSEWLLEQKPALVPTGVASMVFEKLLDRRLSQCLTEHWNRLSFSCRILLACNQSVSHLRLIHLQAS